MRHILAQKHLLYMCFFNKINATENIAALFMSPANKCQNSWKLLAIKELVAGHIILF